MCAETSRIRGSAAAVAKVAYSRGLAVGQAPDDILLHVQSQMYEPRYCSYL